MGYSVEWDGLKIYCETAADVVRLRSEIRKSESPRQPENGSARAKAERSSESANRMILFLETIRRAGPRGIDTPRLTETLGLGGPKGLGAINAAISRRIEPHGVARSDVVTFEKGEDGENVWYPGPVIDQAIEWIQGPSASPAEHSEIQGGLGWS